MIPNQYISICNNDPKMEKETAEKQVTKEKELEKEIGNRID